MFNFNYLKVKNNSKLTDQNLEGKNIEKSFNITL